MQRAEKWMCNRYCESLVRARCVHNLCEHNSKTTATSHSTRSDKHFPERTCDARDQIQDRSERHVHAPAPHQLPPLTHLARGKGFVSGSAVPVPTIQLRVLRVSCQVATAFAADVKGLTRILIACQTRATSQALRVVRAAVPTPPASIETGTTTSWRFQRWWKR